MEAIEKTIEFDEKGNSLLIFGSYFSGKKAKVVVLFENEETDGQSWMKLGNRGQSFDFWNDPAEDIYTLEDGNHYKKGQDEV